MGVYLGTHKVSMIGGQPTGGKSSWMGNNPALIKTLLSDPVYLKDTGYPNWTPSTTASVIVDPVTVFTFPADTENKEYLIHTQFVVYLYYGQTAQTKGMFIDGNGECWHGIARYASNLSNIIAENHNQNGQSVILNQLITHYYAVNGTESTVYSMSYGIYTAMQNPAFSNTTSTNPTITINSPQILARCHDSFFSPANAALVDEDESYYRVKYEVWEVDAGSSFLRNIQDDRMDVFNNGVS